MRVEICGFTGGVPVQLRHLIGLTTLLLALAGCETSLPQGGAATSEDAALPQAAPAPPGFADRLQAPSDGDSEVGPPIGLQGNLGTESEPQVVPQDEAPHIGRRRAFEAALPGRRARHDQALWDRLLAAGGDAGPRPFGVEAQRVLRLEKGHLIVGQDSDAMTTPEEAQLAWAVAGKKAFFVGQRSLALRARHPSKRRLVGFALPPDAPLPQESQLVVRDGEMVGFVTSVVRSPTLGQTIGLAYTAADAAEPGAGITIRLTDGGLVRGQVVTLPFYDPKNQRQEG